MRNLHCRQVILGYSQSGRSTVHITISKVPAHGRVQIDTASLTDYRHIALYSRLIKLKSNFHLNG